MSDINFTKTTLNNEDVYCLQSGTKYLPSIYIKKNSKWNRWMIYEASSNQAITSLTFKSIEDCTDHVKSYDHSTKRTLEILYTDIEQTKLRDIVKEIDFSNPQAFNLNVNRIEDQETIERQRKRIVNEYNLTEQKLVLVCAFFNQQLCLYINKVEARDKQEFYLFTKGNISTYKSWKTISVALKLIKKINEYNNDSIIPFSDFNNTLPSYKEQLEKKILEGHEAQFLHGGTKYLPSIYLQKNEHLNRWMIFESKEHQPITHRTFMSEEECISFISSYDIQSDETLKQLRNNIKDPTLNEKLRSIDFNNPTISITTQHDDEVHRIITTQRKAIASTYDIEYIQVQPMSQFFEGLVSLYTNGSRNRDERIFYLFDNGQVTQYKLWKTVALAMTLCEKLVHYDNERQKYSYLSGLANKSFITTNGTGLFFDEHIKDTGLMYVRKVQVTLMNGQKVADRRLPLAPLFVASVKVSDGLLTLVVKNRLLNVDDNNETYTIEIIND